MNAQDLVVGMPVRVETTDSGGALVFEGHIGELHGPDGALVNSDGRVRVVRRQSTSIFVKLEEVTQLVG